ncbi:MAG: hypothetical protein KDC05_13690 [Bacteroidales bacterium]|nr:hypothetical protein [Bacteroidales bacterium]
MAIRIFLLTVFVTLIRLTPCAQNAPVTTAGSAETYGETIVIPVTIVDFNNIGSFNLLLTYDESIAIATSVSSGSSLGGAFTSNYSVPGSISVGWYTIPGLTLSDSTVIFFVEFAKIAGGITDLVWVDNGNSCIYRDGNLNTLNDIPTSDYYINGSINFLLSDGPILSIANVTICEGSGMINIPVYVFDFDQIGTFNLTILIDSLVLDYQSFINNSGFPALSVNELNAGKFVADGFTESPDGYSLNDSSVLLTLQFDILGDTTAISWFDDGESCEFRTHAPGYFLLNDDPQSYFYQDGSFNQLMAPAILLQPFTPDTVIAGSGTAFFLVEAVGDGLSYQWQEYINDWNDINDGGVYSGTQTFQLMITNPPITMNGFKYRCIVSGFCDPHAVTDGTAHLIVVLDVGIIDKNHLIDCCFEPQLLPNPFSENLYLCFNSPSIGELFIEWYDVSGKKIAQSESEIVAIGKNKIKIDQTVANSGVYTVVFTFTNKRNRYIKVRKVLCCHK